MSRPRPISVEGWRRGGSLFGRPRTPLAYHLRVGSERRRHGLWKHNRMGDSREIDVTDRPRLCVTRVLMPLVKLFTRPGLSKAVPLAPLQTRLCEIWKTTPSTTKLMRFDAADWTGESFDEDVYVDVRAKATPERTREVVLDGMARVQQAFADHGLVANVRLETCAAKASVE